MSNFKLKGKIEKFLDVESGTSKQGKEWSKQCYLLRTDNEYTPTYCFEVFGVEKVENLTKYNKVGDLVDVTFSINVNEWNGKYYTSLSSFRIDKDTDAVSTTKPKNGKIEREETPDSDPDLPF